MYLAHEKGPESKSCIIYNPYLKTSQLIENIIKEVEILGGKFEKILTVGTNPQPGPAPGPTTPVPTNINSDCDITYIHVSATDLSGLPLDPAGTDIKVYLHMSENDVISFSQDDYLITSSVSSIDNGGIPDAVKPTPGGGVKQSYEFSALYNMINAFNQTYSLLLSVDTVSLLSTFKEMPFNFGGYSTSLLKTSYFNVPTLLAKHDGSLFALEKNMTTSPNLYYAFESTRYKICNGINNKEEEYSPYGIILLYASEGYNATSDLKVYQVLQAEVMNMNKVGGLDDKSIVIFPVNYVQDYETMVTEVFLFIYLYNYLLLL